MKKRIPDVRRLAGGLILLLLAACSGSECVSGPLCGGTPDPDPDPDPTPTVASIGVTSPIDSLLAVGRSAQMAATARDASGNALTGVSLTWSSSNPSVATVSSTGLVTGVAAGPVTIQAVSGSITGGVSLRAVGADLQSVATVLGDPFVPAMIDRLASGTNTSLATFLAACSTALSNGHVSNVEQCLDSIRNTTGTDGTDTALLAVLRLYADYATAQLNLGR